MMTNQLDPRQEPGFGHEDDALDVVGMWVTADGHIRQELRADGRYDEARGTRRSAYTGHYTVTGAHLDYVDDTGFTATGDIRDGVLFHEHLVLYMESGPERPAGGAPSSSADSKPDQCARYVP